MSERLKPPEEFAADLRARVEAQKAVGLRVGDSETTDDLLLRIWQRLVALEGTRLP